jgi:hypothetical protein
MSCHPVLACNKYNVYVCVNILCLYIHKYIWPVQLGVIGSLHGQIEDKHDSRGVICMYACADISKISMTHMESYACMHVLI